MKRITITVATGFLIAVFVFPGSPRAQSAPNAKGNKPTLGMLAAEVATLTQTVSTLQTTVQSLQNQLSSANAQNAFALGQFVTVDTKNTINGLSAPHIIFTGANLHVRSGSGTTFDNTPLGNLVIGYDADSSSSSGGCSGTVSQIHANRDGSHNLIIGDCHEFIGSGGFVAGFSNRLGNNSASVSGGRFNDAGLFSSVSGGLCNTAGQPFQTLGCDSLIVPGGDASVTGGISNNASGAVSSVNGGGSNVASGQGSSVGGGQSQNATMTGQNIN